MKVALLTAGKDPHYALGLAPALALSGIELEFVGNSEMEVFPAIRHPNIRYFNLRGDQRDDATFVEKVRRVLLYYVRLLRFAGQSQAQVFHVLWTNKFVYFDRTLLNLYYRALGKKLVFTAHNVNTEARDRKDSFLNRLSLKIHYHLMDHIFVHTAEMQAQLIKEFAVRPDRITVVTFPVNNVTPRTNLTREAARLRLGIPGREKAILFFGMIAAYKGLEDLIRAVPQLRSRLESFRVLVVGSVKKGEEDYVRRVRQLIRELAVDDLVDEYIEYIPEEEVELYLKAADLVVLPYRRIFQSGVLFLSYAFGVPVVVSDVGSFREDVIEGQTGFLCRACDPGDLAEQIIRYFNSDLFAELDSRRAWIVDHVNKTYSWERLATKTHTVYENLLRAPGWSRRGSEEIN